MTNPQDLLQQLLQTAGTSTQKITEDLLGGEVQTLFQEIHE